MTGYTKGKWEISFPDASEDQPYRIGCLNANGVIGWNHQIAYVEGKANAQLIVSAPELYEALKNALAILRSTKPTQNAINVVIIDAISAINNAEGKPDATK